MLCVINCLSLSLSLFRRLPCRRVNSIRLHLDLGQFIVMTSHCVMMSLLYCSGLAGGEENGRRGYQMTFAIAYIRVRIETIAYHSIGCIETIAYHSIGCIETIAYHSMLLLGLLKVLLTVHSMLLGLFVMQDLAFDYCYLAESFETSVPWSRSVFIIISYLPVNTYTHSLTKPPTPPSFSPFYLSLPLSPPVPPSPPSPSPSLALEYWSYVGM